MPVSSNTRFIADESGRNRCVLKMIAEVKDSVMLSTVSG